MPNPATNPDTATQATHGPIEVVLPPRPAKPGITVNLTCKAARRLLDAATDLAVDRRELDTVLNLLDRAIPQVYYAQDPDAHATVGQLVHELVRLFDLRPKDEGNWPSHPFFCALITSMESAYELRDEYDTHSRHLRLKVLILVRDNLLDASPTIATAAARRALAYRADGEPPIFDLIDRLDLPA